MAIKNPNDIVDEFVADYMSVFGDDLVSVLLYGSAASHEYRPGVSDINTAIVVKDDSLAALARCMPLQKKWDKRGVTTPFFMTREYIASSLDSYPIEFLDMRSNYRVLSGEDVLKDLDIRREHVRLQCERELKGASLHLRKGYIQTGGTDKYLHELLSVSIRKLIPVCKALLVLGDRQIPAAKSDVLGEVEDHYSLGVSIFSQIYLAGPGEFKGRYTDIFNSYGHAIDSLVKEIDTMES